MGKTAYSVGFKKEEPKPFEAALAAFKPAVNPGKDEGTKIAVQENSANDKSVPVLVLPDLGKIEVPKVDAEALAKIGQEAKDRKVWAEGAGAKMIEIQERISKLESDPNTKLSPSAQHTLGLLKAAEQQLLAAMAGDPALKEHVEFSRLLNEIRAIRPEHTGEVFGALTKVIQMGHYRLATSAEVEAGRKGKWPDDTQFFEGRVYFALRERDGRRKALAAELRKLIEAAKLSKAAAMKSRGNADLIGFTCERPRTTMYYGFLPKHEVPQTDGPSLKIGEGHLLWELIDRNKGRKDQPPYLVVEIKQAEGSLWRLADRSQGRTDVPYRWVELGFVIPPKDRETGKPRRLLDEEFRRALKIVKTIRAICAAAGHPFPEQKKPEAKPAEKAAETSAPAPALPLEQVLGALVDAAIPQAPEPSTEKSEKKGKKVKK